MAVRQQIVSAAPVRLFIMQIHLAPPAPPPRPTCHVERDSASAYTFIGNKSCTQVTFDNHNHVIKNSAKFSNISFTSINSTDIFVQIKSCARM